MNSLREYKNKEYSQIYSWGQYNINTKITQWKHKKGKLQANFTHEYRYENSK